ncbi:MAG: TIGR03936 family radical SAM-associated protein [Clostridia bacterium]|nr:TIGR03936 family radical SAM-associated protein [Clostridia bacterium]
MKSRRVRFSKTGMGKYISHLDLLRCFTRAIQRSGLPVVYSQGFNPHQKMTFALPLSIGVTSECETVDIQFEDWVSDAEIMEKLSANLPMDMQVLSVGDPTPKASEIVAAEYRMEAGYNGNIDKEQMNGFFSQTEIPVTKRTKKKGETSVNLLDYLRSWEITGITDTGFCIRVIVDAGERNLKPELLATALEAYLAPIEITEWDITRKRIFVCPDGETLSEFC